jgi:2-keto-4-pentenoate hydratase/2-oxohepta-3-ene-1,7-dioic acid hydratase in catechol pathway
MVAVTLWMRFLHKNRLGFGTQDGDQIIVHEGDMFQGAVPAGWTVPLADVELSTPCAPSKMICLWNNFRALAAKFNYKEPAEPLYFLKAQSAFQAGGTRIPRPKNYSGRVVFEGELGIVIGKECRAVSEADAPAHIFGYTCVNDVTAFDLLNKDPSFQQWTRAKSFDGFGVFGPVIATSLDPRRLSIRTVLEGQERQNYPVTDMFFEPYRLLSLISQDLTLLPGDIISCGTSLGSGSMKPGNKIDISIVGIGMLSNVME